MLPGALQKYPICLLLLIFNYDRVTNDCEISSASFL